MICHFSKLSTNCRQLGKFWDVNMKNNYLYVEKGKDEQPTKIDYKLTVSGQVLLRRAKKVEKDKRLKKEMEDWEIEDFLNE